MWSALAFAVAVLLLVGGCGASKEFSRYQKRADAVNKTKIVKQEIKTMDQKAQVIHAQEEVTRARARQRIIEAEGIRAAQDKIAATLTPLYVQHEAIRAQENDRQGDRTYIPVGPQGVPLVADTNADSVRQP
jgi:hypothetical protein